MEVVKLFRVETVAVCAMPCILLKSLLGGTGTIVPQWLPYPFPILRTSVVLPMTTVTNSSFRDFWKVWEMRATYCSPSVPAVIRQTLSGPLLQLVHEE